MDKLKTENKIYFILLILIIMLIRPINAAFVDYDDEWETAEGTDSDAAVWGSYYLYIYSHGVNIYADCMCFDWCDDGGSDDDYWSDWDHCFCKSTQTRDDCKTYSSWVNSICGEGNCVIQSDLEYGHNIDTGSSGNQANCAVDIREYRDCDGSSGQQGIYNWATQEGRDYWIVYGHQYDCDADPGPSTDPDYEGDFGSWLNIYANTGKCSASEECDENHDAIVSYTSSATPSDPCRTKNWYSCSSGSDCISDKCEQNECSTCSSTQCTSAYWDSCINDGDLCCSGDDTPDQYYCEYDETWEECSDESHTGCQYVGSGDYYCTYESGDWKWRECEFGCSGNSCTEPDIDVSPDPLVFNVGGP